MNTDKAFTTNYTHMKGIDFRFASLDRRLTGKECETLAAQYFDEHHRMTLPGQTLFVDLRPAFRKSLADITPKFHTFTKTNTRQGVFRHWPRARRPLKPQN